MQEKDNKKEAEVIVEQIEEKGQAEQQAEEVQKKENEADIHASTALFLDEAEIEKLEETVLENEKKIDDEEEVSTDEIVAVEEKIANKVLEEIIGSDVSEVDKEEMLEDKAIEDVPTNKEIPNNPRPLAATNYFTFLVVIIVTFLVTWGFFSVNNENFKVVNEKKIDLLSVDIMTLKREVAKLKQENQKLRSGVKSIVANTQKELELLLSEKKETIKKIQKTDIEQGVTGK